MNEKVGGGGSRWRHPRFHPHHPHSRSLARVCNCLHVLHYIANKYTCPILPSPPLGLALACLPRLFDKFPSQRREEAAHMEPATRKGRRRRRRRKEKKRKQNDVLVFSREGLSLLLLLLLWLLLLLLLWLVVSVVIAIIAAVAAVAVAVMVA